MGTDTVNQLVNSIDMNAGTMLFKLLIVAVILLLFKNLAENLAGYIQWVFDKHSSIGSSVEIYGKQGTIVSVNLFTVSIQTEKGFIRIPIKDWRTSKYELYKTN